MLSHRHAPHGKILRLPLATPDLTNAKTIISEGSGVIQDFQSTLAGQQPSFDPDSKPALRN